MSVKDSFIAGFVAPFILPNNHWQLVKISLTGENNRTTGVLKNLLRGASV
jgi:hypothetical protein